MSAEAFDPDAFLPTLPEAPGVYRMRAADGAVLYVGKAKNLRKRVSSYFQKTGHSPRIGLMLQQVAGMETTATRSETEALILENTLIKQLKPKYNILFRDDKSYAYIGLSGGDFPRLFYHRGAIRPPPKAPLRGALPPGGRDALGAARRASPEKKSHYFGPFPSGSAVRESIQLIQKTFLLRTCEEAVFAHRSRPCLLHQIGRCKAPCVGRVAAADYAEDVKLAELFLRGRHGEVIEKLTALMESESAALRFERAAALRDQVKALQAVLHRQYVSSTQGADVDIVAAVAERGELCVNLAMVRGGLHLGDRAHFPQANVAASAAEGLAAFLEQHYADHEKPPRLILDPWPPEEVPASLRCGPAKNEMERAWLEMALNNARLALTARRQATARAGGRLEALRVALDLPEAPRRIECFDISHTLGEGTVASCVVCVDGAMKKGDYRRFNITGITPGDDYAAMRQALMRRYEKLAKGGAGPPQADLRPPVGGSEPWLRAWGALQGGAGPPQADLRPPVGGSEPWLRAWGALQGGAGGTAPPDRTNLETAAPDLVLIDGGKGQHAVAREVFAELGLNELASIGVAKGEERKSGLETLFVHGSTEPLELAMDNAGFHLIQEIRDEAHRFAIVGHRARRAKVRGRSALEDVAGIGPTRRRKLLAHFGGLAGVKAATVEDLCRVHGISRALAESIHKQLH